MLDISAFIPAGDPLGQTEVMSLVVDGVRYTAFIHTQVRAGYDEAARVFETRIAAELGASATNSIFHAGASVQVFATNDLLLDGYVDQKRPHLGAHEATITVTGRSKSADLIDSDVDHETGYFENKDPLEIAKAISDGYGAQYVTDQQLSKLDRHHLTPGETIHRAVEKLARRQGKTLAGTADGNVNITAPSGQRHAGGLYEGVNILVGNADHNWSNRHSKYSYAGQKAVGTEAKRLHLVAGATDSAVNRKRTHAGVHDDDAKNIGELKTRVKNRRDRAAGASLKATISTQGFRDMAGTIYTPGFLIWTESPYLDIAQDMLIEATDFSQGPEGSIALLSLVDQRAYGGKGGKGDKSGPEWQAGDDEPTDQTPADAQ